MNVLVTDSSQIRFGEHWDQNLEDLAMQALEPLAEHLQTADMLYISNTFAGSVLDIASLGSFLKDRLGLHLPVREITTAGDSSGAFAILTAATAIDSGSIKKAVLLGVEKISDLLSTQVESVYANLLDPSEQFCGMTMAGAYALMAKVAFEKYGISPEHLAQISLKNHTNSQNNPAAQYQFEVSLEKITNSPQVADPLRMFDCASLCDGAAALVLEQCDEQSTGVKLIGSGYGQGVLPLHKRSDLAVLTATENASKEAYEQAQIGPEQIDLAEVHDMYTISEAMAMVDLALVGYDALAIWIANKNNTISGKLPINPSGGLKACGHAAGATGIRQAIEIATQLRGEAGQRQVEKPSIGMTHTLSGSGAESVVNIFTIK